MMYEVVRQSDNQRWYLENPAFVRLGSDGEYFLTPESNAYAVYIEGTCYHIVGRTPIQGLDDVTVGIGSESPYTNQEVTNKLDSMDATIDDILVALVEE